VLRGVCVGQGGEEGGGSGGLAVLAAAIRAGALPRLVELDLSGNPLLGDLAVARFLSAAGWGFGLEVLILDRGADGGGPFHRHAGGRAA
jgi:hypothetical protein